MRCLLGWAIWDGSESAEQLLMRADYAFDLERSGVAGERRSSAVPTNPMIANGQVLPAARCSGKSPARWGGAAQIPRR